MSLKDPKLCEVSNKRLYLKMPSNFRDQKNKTNISKLLELHTVLDILLGKYIML